MERVDCDRAWIEREFLEPLLVNFEADAPELQDFFEREIFSALREQKAVYAELLGLLPLELRGRFESLPLPLQLNALLACFITYRPGLEAYPANPSLVFSRGFGRCGELSTLLVRLLRQAGIPARQVYVPLWAHCDDNHAWVEFFWEGRWHFVGAAEPEWELDRGWFIPAASRAPWVACRVETPPPGQKVPRLRDGGYLLTSNELYFEPKTLTLIFENLREGSTLEVAPLLYNEGYLRPLAVFLPDEEGRLTLSCNRVDLRLGIFDGDAYYELPLEADCEGDYQVDLSGLEPLYRCSQLGAPQELKVISSELRRQEAPPQTRSFPPSSRAERQAHTCLVEACATIQRGYLRGRENGKQEVLHRLEQKGVRLSSESLEKVALLGHLGTALLRDVETGRRDQAEITELLTGGFEQLLYVEAMLRSPRRAERKPLNSEEWLLEDCRWGEFCLLEEGQNYPPLYAQVMKSFRQASGALDILHLSLLLPAGAASAAEIASHNAPEWREYRFAKELRPTYQASELLLELLGQETGILAFLGERDEPSVRMRFDFEKVKARYPEMKIVIYPIDDFPWELQREYDLAENDLSYTLVVVDRRLIAAESGAEWSLLELLQGVYE